jgi:hypothetical protein
MGAAGQNFGFIKFVQIQRSIIEVELHPRAVAIPALLAVQQQILTAPVTLFRIKHLDQSWQSEISSSAEATIARLSELCAPVYLPPQNDRFIVEPKDFAALFDDEHHPWRPLAQKWRMSFANFDPSVISLAASARLLSRLIVIGIKPQQDPVFRFIGDGHKWLGNDYQLNGIGEKIEQQPDHEYGSWVSEFYKAVAASGIPRYDIVTAQLRYEAETGKPQRPVCYERLLLPWKTSSSEVFVTGWSTVVDTAAAATPPPSRVVAMKSARSS